MTLTLGLFRYDGAATAARVLHDLRHGPAHAAPWLAEVGLLERHRHGRVSMRATWHGEHFEEKEGQTPIIATALGALTGAMLGLFAGPGLLVGAVAGGVAGGTLGAVDQLDEEETLFEDLRRDLPRDTSALMLLADEGAVDELARHLAGTGATGSRRSVSRAFVDRLERWARPKV